MAESALAVVQRAYGAFARGDVTAMLAVLDPDVVWCSPDGTPWGGEFHGREGVREFVGRLAGSVETVSVEVTRWLPSGEGCVVVEGVDVFTHLHRTLRHPFTHVCDVHDGLVTAFTEYSNVLPVRDLLGVPILW